MSGKSPDQDDQNRVAREICRTLNPPCSGVFALALVRQSVQFSSRNHAALSLRLPDKTIMKHLRLSLAVITVLLLGLCVPQHVAAARPNPPTIEGIVPVVVFGGTNSVPVPPRVRVLDERGRIVADVETTVDGIIGTFEIRLKKAGTYVVWAYYPETTRETTAQLVDVLRKQTVTVLLSWPPL